MYNDIFKPLLKEFRKEIENMETQALRPAQKLHTSNQYILTVIDKLKILIKDHPFPDQGEEINFFKNIKPGIYANKIFWEEYYRLNMNQPSGPHEMIKAYLVEEIRQINRFFSFNAFHYQYYKMSAVELDAIYFVRGAPLPAIPIIEIPELNPDFSTGMDYVFSRFIAYERLLDYIINRLNEEEPAASEKKSKVKKKGLKWTGDKIGVVELAYGLYYSGDINHGEVEVQDIVEALEFAFEIIIGDGHRKFVDIRNRKSISPTQLLDKMRTAILQRIEEDMVYRSNRGIRLRKPIK
jgi:hypothetical protein